MKRRSVLICSTAVAGSLIFAAYAADTEDWGSFQVADRRSGYTYAHTETRAIQDDDFDNPGYIWVEKGAELWETQDGVAGKSCVDCHDDVDPHREQFKGQSCGKCHAPTPPTMKAVVR